MTPEMIYTSLVVLAVLAALASNRVPAEVTMMAALVAVLVGDVITPAQALAGFANPGLMTVAVLYVVAAALRDTGAIFWVAHKLLGQPKSALGSQLRLIAPTSLLSAFLNNTTVVAMMIPAVQEWAQRLKLSASQLLLPLSYAAILGGTCTLIGTSTNLVVDGLMQERGLDGFHIFDLAWVGVPLLIVGSLFLLLFGRRLLPHRQGMVEQVERAREYHVEVVIPEGSPLHNKTIQDAGLRNLTHGYLTEIQRGDKLFTAVGPDMLLQAGDQLAFIGAPDCARELQRINGLVPAHGGAHKLRLNNHQRCLVEVVIGPEFPGLNQTVKEAGFRTRYQAAILSISRGGRRLPGKVGEQTLRIGDTLLLETGNAFVEQYRYRRDFMLVSPLSDSTPPDFSKAPLATAILVGMVGVNVLGLLSVLEAAFIAAGLLLVTRCVTVNRARMNVSVNLPVLVVIGAAFALGTALEQSGTAAWIVDALIGQGLDNPWLALLAIYLITALFTEVITNNAAAVLVFPIANGVAAQLGVSPLPYIVAVMFAASASFMTPLGYQTNLMVMGPGGYRFTDYLKIGVPMSILAAAVSTTLIPLVWAF
ncbi:MAG: SLC13 family permease [Alcanivorax sp.]|nr:SLC13 family permease [Alcanivorax sp.]MAY11066.1 SLC13 family permease [Alcanivorax sp.]MBI53008.1 SLC13 family permease [Alcanivorax sp.]MBU60348.1 SLC13 family permease [Alcanivorax sp.]MBU60826.1 SLC13 family permease [Alcanivorax sp.]|tara:strand:- start:11680 stop:13452 length:1773 start_codon:yes stop_codon:yes gene_type:complete